MSDRAVPDIFHSCECPTENCELTLEDDINWCTGFWNELVRENPPSLYPGSPIFSSKLCDWDDPLFPENVFICPDVEELLSGKHFLSEQPAIIDSSFETKSDEDIFAVYPTGNSTCNNSVNDVTKSSPPSSTPKQKKKRQRKSKANDEHETPSKRKPANTTRKTKIEN